MTDMLDDPRDKTANVLWFLPTHGDGRYLGTSLGARDVSLRYLAQIAQAADELGYFGVLLPTGRSCEDSWIIASALAPLTRAAALPRRGAARPAIAGGRRAHDRDPRPHPRRPASRSMSSPAAIRSRTRATAFSSITTSATPSRDEFLHIYTRLLAGETVTFKGAHLHVEDSQLLFPPVQPGGPPLYFGGSSPAGQTIAAKTVQKYLTWGEPPALVAAKIADMRARAVAFGRTLSYGIRLHVIVRETAAEAWAAAESLISHVDDATIAAAQKSFARMDSVGQQRMSALHQGRRDKLEISPNLWAGVGLVRGGAGTALVGDPDTVAQRMREYIDAGIDTFILSGYPHLEEAYRFAELVLPRLPLAAATHAPRTASSHRGPFGEMVGNAFAPPSASAS